MSDKKVAFLTPTMFQAVLDKTGGKPQRDARGRKRAHRVTYVTAFGEPPKGLDLDHLCRMRCCVNPIHLEPVTRSENAKRSPIMGQGQSKKTHCPKGHPYSEANTYRKPDGRRVCRTCTRKNP